MARMGPSCPLRDFPCFPFRDGSQSGIAMPDMPLARAVGFRFNSGGCRLLPVALSSQNNQPPRAFTGAGAC